MGICQKPIVKCIESLPKLNTFSRLVFYHLNLIRMRLALSIQSFIFLNTSQLNCQSFLFFVVKGFKVARYLCHTQAGSMIPSHLVPRIGPLMSGTIFLALALPSPYTCIIIVYVCMVMAFVSFSGTMCGWPRSGWLFQWTCTFILVNRIASCRELLDSFLSPGKSRSSVHFAISARTTSSLLDSVL